MYPVLILRCELVCLFVLLFLFLTSKTYHVGKDTGAFYKLLIYATIHVVFDAVTVITVNHTDTVPAWLNWLCHIIFYVSAILFSNRLVNYVAVVSYPGLEKKFYAAGHILLAVYLCCLPLLKIEYVEDVGTWSSAGSAAIAGYSLSFLLFLSAFVIIFINIKKLPRTFTRAMLPMMTVLIVIEICQIIWKSILFTGGAITIVTLGVFFSLENPVEVFRLKAMTDALTGVQTRSSYEADLEKYDAEFKKNRSDGYIFVFCDVNDLRSVNNRFGHGEGDNYISLIAAYINEYMKHSTAVYRIGGDEFLIFYYRTDESIVEKEILEVQAACTEVSKTLDYTAGVAAGYAKSSESVGSLLDVVKTADYAMYRNKVELKNGTGRVTGALGTGLNLAGLTEHMFDAMCAANNKMFPFITNMETNVTRISPLWKEYFGLDREFYGDFVSVWTDRIHPDYREGYTADIISMMNGRQKYHNFDYPARKADGEYVPVSCHGSLYKDSVTGVSYFTGFITVNI